MSRTFLNGLNMDDERPPHAFRAPTDAASPNDSAPRNNGTLFTSINPRSQRSNGRSSLSLNRHRHSQQTNPNTTRTDNGSSGSATVNPAQSSSRNDSQFPSIRFRSVQAPSSRQTVDAVSPLAEMNVRQNAHGLTSLPPTTAPSNGNTACNNHNTGNATNSRRRPSQTRNRFQPAAAATGASGTNDQASASTSSSKNHRHGTSPRRRHVRRNAGGGNGDSTNSNNQGHSRAASTVSPINPTQSHRPRRSQPRQHRPSHLGLEGFSDDSEDDISLMLMNAPPRMRNMSMDDFATPPPDLMNAVSGYRDFRGMGTADSPLELLNEYDPTSGPSVSQSEELSRDEEFARQLQQEEWERAATPMGRSMHNQMPDERVRFLQAMHQALGDGPEARPLPRARHGARLPSLPTLIGARQSLQIPVLMELLPPGLMEAILGNGHFPPEEDDYEALLAMEEQLGAVSRGMNQRDINKIPTQKHMSAVTSSPSNNSDSSCAICLSEFSAGESKRILPCQHELHKDCIDPWLKTNATCPICRKDIRESG